jgi:hypothetical protein
MESDSDEEGGIQELKQHSFFNGVDWEGMRLREVPPPFMPDIENDADVSNIDKAFLNSKMDGEHENPKRSKTTSLFDSADSYFTKETDT